MNKRYRKRSIQWLVLFMLVAVYVVLLAVGRLFINYSQNSLRKSAQTLTEVCADELFFSVNEMWYQLRLVSAAFSRSDAMAAFLHSENGDTGDSLFALKSAADMTKMFNGTIDSVIVTDFNKTELFAYGNGSRRVLEDAASAMMAGERIEYPMLKQVNAEGKSILYCINRTEYITDRAPMYTIIIYNMDNLQVKLKELSGGEYGMNVLLLDANNVPILKSTTLNQTELERVIHQENMGVALDSMLFVQTRNLPHMGWRLIAFVQESALDKLMSGQVSFVRTISLAMLLSLVVFFMVLRKQVNEPIRQISQFLNSQTQASSLPYLELNTKNELNQIAQDLNIMLQKQRKMIRENLENKERVYETELAQKQTEIEALAHQINPHFLYNTLDCLHGMALARDYYDMEVIISSMASILRYATRGGMLVPLSEELDSIANYMNIVNVRHGGRINVSYEVEPGLSDLLIPKMILQPVVENAVFHGLEPVSRNGLLTIRIWREEQRLKIEVIDNGCGMDECTLKRLQEGFLSKDAVPSEASSHHIGLINIHRRIRLMYDETCGIMVTSGTDEGTRVLLCMKTNPGSADVSNRGE